jgi:hypothetical protein
MEPGPEETDRFAGGDADVWNEIIGPVYGAAGLERAFGITAARLGELVESKAVLGLQAADGLVGFPANLFDASGRPLPRLAEVQANLMRDELVDEWTVALWLNDRPAVWDGASAIELLVSEWAEEVVTQSGEHGRSPLWARVWQEEKMAIARPILDRFVELVVELPVDVAEETLFVTRETEVPYGVFAMSLTGERRALIPIHFEIDGDVEATARWMADEVVRQEPWNRARG